MGTNGDFESVDDKTEGDPADVASFQNITVGKFQLSQLICPKSRYKGYAPPLPPCKERVVVQELLDEVKQRDPKGPQIPNSDSRMAYSPFDEINHIDFELSNFTVYLPETTVHHSCEMRGLQHLTTKIGHSNFLFDGILSVGDVRRYVQGVPFKKCPIGNYGEEFHTVESEIWIQSDHNSRSEIYYRLRTPSNEYARFHEGFLWLADLAKHFVDFCQASEHAVSIHDFRTDFSAWMKQKHDQSSQFQAWYRQYDSDDFRRAVAVNISFLFKESVGVNDELRSLPIFRELLELDAIPEHRIEETKTIVTPYVYECFKELKFGHHLEAVDPLGISVSRPQFTVPLKSWQAPAAGMEPDSDQEAIRRRKIVKSIKAGDVLSVTKDGKGSVWKDEVSRWKAVDHCWYTYVQRVHEKDGKRSFDAIWLYKPSDTSCAKMKYPFPNELFLSDNCTCRNQRITEEEVLDVVEVIWHGHPSLSNQTLFIRQTYLENQMFVTLKDSHKRCEHLEAAKETLSPGNVQRYKIGETVLAPCPRKSKYGLEVYEVAGYVTDASKPRGILRQLKRRHEVDATGRPNELVYTDKTDNIPINKIERTCLVRFYSESEIATRSIPAPYNRDGTGNAFYITTRLVEVDGVCVLKPIKDDLYLPKSLLQGFDPSKPPPRKVLRGMDLYCGGGNFGRGLEEGEAVHMEWAADINKTAIHTYHANLKDRNATKLFYGSVDDMLKQAMLGNPLKSRLIPLPGEVDFISAGSPCQGFSALNSDRNNEKGLKNQSLVASVAAYIDYYRPSYGILENVMNMAQKGRGRDEDVLSQLICSIVGMGYQLSLFVLDAWSCGSPQSRTRLFVSFAAPGLEPLQHPGLSHSHPPNVTSRGLGMQANGEPFGQRMHGLTPFKYVTASEATRDLPKIGDGCTYQCTRQPDHVMFSGVSTTTRLQIEAIPILPRGMNFAKAWKEGRGVMTVSQRELFQEHSRSGKIRENQKRESKAWGRVDPRGLFSTVVVAVAVNDSRMGTTIHWEENRYLTVMEARRAQGFPDNEVLVGTSANAQKLMGNSVARTVSLPLGLSLREAWLKNRPDIESEFTPLSARAKESRPAVVISREIRRPIAASKARRSHQLVDSPASFASETHISTKPIPSSSVIIDVSNTKFIAPNKARRSRPIQDSSRPSTLGPNKITKAPLILTESRKGPSIQPRPGATKNTPQTRLEVPDSLESSADEAYISEETINKFMGSLALRNSTNRDETPSSRNNTESDSNRDGKPKSLKRRHGVLQESRILSPEKLYKQPRVSGISSPSSRPMNRSASSSCLVILPAGRPKDQALNASALSNKLQEVKKSRTSGQLGSGKDSDSKKATSISLSSLASAELVNRFK
jgi:DNA (cytosine-5)-methyltransferase 1